VLNLLNNFQEIIGIVEEVLKNTGFGTTKTLQTKIFAGFREMVQVNCFDKVVLEWFNGVGNKNMPVSEPMVQEKPKALEIAR